LIIGMVKDRIQSLLGAIHRGIYEKDTELYMALLAALAGESIILLGPPGVAKSMVARRLKLAFRNAHSFEYLMSRFSTPDEIFGPVSISKLKDDDKYERNTVGYLPTADVVFLDEIWKAGPAIQNTLLTVMNEKVFRNGDTEIKLPLKLLVAASNELPTQGEGLEALWDRFVIRLECHNIKDENNFNAMLLDVITDEDISIPAELQISSDEYSIWGDAINHIGVSKNVLKCINVIRKSLTNVHIGQTDEYHNIYVSDRRWKQIIRLLRTSAFIHDRTEVSLQDILPICNCLWQEPEEMEGVRSIVIHSLFLEFTESVAKLRQELDNDIRINRQHRATEKARNNMKVFDSDKKIFDTYYYHLLDHDTGNTYILISDYQNLKQKTRENLGQGGLIYKDPKNPKRSIISSYDGADKPAGANPVSLTRDEKCIYINGVRFFIETLKRGERQSLPTKKGNLSGHDYYHEIEELSTDIKQRNDELMTNILISDQIKKEVSDYVQKVFLYIAHTRQDLEKLED